MSKYLNKQGSPRCSFYQHLNNEYSGPKCYICRIINKLPDQMKTKYSLLAIIPYKPANITTEKEDNLVVIVYPRFKKKWMEKIFLPKKMSPYIRVRLDEHGSAVWDEIDGARTVEEIINRLTTHFEGEREYQSRVTTFITLLRKDNLIKYRIKS